MNLFSELLFIPEYVGFERKKISFGKYTKYFLRVSVQNKSTTYWPRENNLSKWLYGVLKSKVLKEHFVT